MGWKPDNRWGANVAGCKRTQLLAFSGWSYNGGKLIGPDGSEQDSETFLASLTITANQGFHCCDAADGAFFLLVLMFMMQVTQSYSVLLHRNTVLVS